MNNLIMAISFFTNIKMPEKEFTEKNYKYLPLMLIFVGLIIGTIGYVVNMGLLKLSISPILHATVLTIYFVYITGAIHVDGLLDTVDAHFSRRDLARRLEIMHDSNIGVFACVFAILFFVLKIVILRELIVLNYLGYNLIYIPIISRLFTGLMISVCKFATDKGLANMYKNVVKNWYRIVIVIQIFAVTIVWYFFDKSVIICVALILVYFLLYVNFMYRNFKGITGDILGAFVETSELLLFIVFIGGKLWL